MLTLAETTLAHAAVERSSRSVMAPKGISEIKQRLDDVRASSHINDLFARRIELDNEFKKPDVWDDPQRASGLSKEISDVQSTIDAYSSACKLYDDVVCAYELAQEDEACEPLLESRGSRASSTKRMPFFQ